MKSHKLKKPSWKEDNSVQRLVKMGLTKKQAAKRQKENNAIKKILEKNGWKFWDSVNILYQGYTLSFKKEIGSLSHPTVTLSWHWDNQGGDDFFVGQLYGFRKLYADEPNPHAMVEISRFYEKNLIDLPSLEKNVNLALNSFLPIT